MRFIGNIIWFVFGGWYLGLTWILGAILFAITIIGLPLTRAAIEMAKMSAFPFGKDVVHIREIDQEELSATTGITGTIGFIANVIWVLTFGWALFLMYLAAGIICCITIIGIPFGIQSFKLAGISFWPVGRRVVSKEMAEEVRKRAASNELDKKYPKNANSQEATTHGNTQVNDNSQQIEFQNDNSQQSDESKLETKLAEIDKLKDKGIINEEEYEEKKKKIIDEY